jgi:hypothetical protein
MGIVRLLIQALKVHRINGGPSVGICVFAVFTLRYFDKIMCAVFTL